MTEQPPQSNDYFFFMSFNGPGPDGSGIAWYRRTGICTLSPGDTRLAAFEKIRSQLQERDPALRGAVVIAFDMQPNRL